MERRVGQLESGRPGGPPEPEPAAGPDAAALSQLGVAAAAVHSYRKPSSPNIYSNSVLPSTLTSTSRKNISK